MPQPGQCALSQSRGRVFLNFPYDLQFVPLYLAYITGVCWFGLIPRVALELPEESGDWIESFN
jgi:hypothetical protein